MARLLRPRRARRRDPHAPGRGAADPGQRRPRGLREIPEGKARTRGSAANRARLITDEEGYYEYETVHPGRYQIGEGIWRPSHVHYMVRHPGYTPLVTQLYFKGDPMNEKDMFIRASLIIEVKEEKVAGGAYEAGTFDIVLAKS